MVPSTGLPRKEVGGVALPRRRKDSSSVGLGCGKNEGHLVKVQ